MLLYGGIDTGMDGAIAVIDQYGKVIKLYSGFKVNVGKGKTKKGAKKQNNIPDDYNIARALRLCRQYEKKGSHSLLVLLEKQQAMPKQGVVSIFKLAECFGLWKGGMNALKMKYELFHPRTWQKVMLKDANGTDTKARSLNVARRLFPDVSLPLKGDHNKSDALLMAEFLRRRDHASTK